MLDSHVRLKNLRLGFLLGLSPIAVLPVSSYIIRNHRPTQIAVIAELAGFVCSLAAIIFLRRALARRIDWINFAAGAWMILALGELALYAIWLALFARTLKDWLPG